VGKNWRIRLVSEMGVNGNLQWQFMGMGMMYEETRDLNKKWE